MVYPQRYDFYSKAPTHIFVSNVLLFCVVRVDPHLLNSVIAFWFHIVHSLFYLDLFINCLFLTFKFETSNIKLVISEFSTNQNHSPSTIAQWTRISLEDNHFYFTFLRQTDNSFKARIGINHRNIADESLSTSYTIRVVKNYVMTRNIGNCLVYVVGLKDL